MPEPDYKGADALIDAYLGERDDGRDVPGGMRGYIARALSAAREEGRTAERKRIRDRIESLVISTGPTGPSSWVAVMQCANPPEWPDATPAWNSKEKIERDAEERGRRQGLEEAADGCKRIAVQLNEQASSYRGAPFPAGQVESLSIFGNRVALDCERATRALIPQEPTCKMCGGSGSVSYAGDDDTPCPTCAPQEPTCACDGVGMCREHAEDMLTKHPPPAPCETCGGSGRTFNPVIDDERGRGVYSPCPTCHR